MGTEPHPLPKSQTTRIAGKHVDNHCAPGRQARAYKISQRQGPQAFVPVRTIDEELPEVNHRFILFILITTQLVYRVAYHLRKQPYIIATSHSNGKRHPHSDALPFLSFGCWSSSRSNAH